MSRSWSTASASFFRHPYYEFWDLAANSLAVNRAKHFQELYGSYSRWGFHHPGPVFFYVQAFGEWFFYDLLHLTPAPFNAQTLASLCVTTSFFVASLTVFSHWMSESARRWFVPMALIVGALHFGAVSRLPSYDMLLGSSVFSSAWTAHSWVFPFLCMLVAGASVAAGRGEDLPLLALADGMLIHAHIVAPMFVGPVTLGAYTGLLVMSLRRERATAAADMSPVATVWKRSLRALGAPWRAFPLQHAVALSIVGVFALPIVIDLFLGDDNNFHAVMAHMRAHQGEHKKLVRSLFYFVQFGAYRPYKAHTHMFGRYDLAGAKAYLWYHKKIYAAWIAGVLLVIWSSALRPLLIAWGRWSDGGTPEDHARTRFQAWAGAFLLLSIVLSLYWGIIQDGDMFYYSGWVNFAIYYFGLLIVLAEFSEPLASAVRRWKDRASRPGHAWDLYEQLALAGLVLLVCVLHADRFRVSDPTPETNRVMHESYLRAVRDVRTRNPKGTVILDFPFLAWPTVTGLVLEMQRAGQPLIVASVLPVAFPKSMCWQPTSPETQHTMEVWHFTLDHFFKLFVSGVPKWFVPRGKLLERQLAEARRTKPADDKPMFYPLLDGVELRVDLPILDVNAPGGADLSFRKADNGSADTPVGYLKHPSLVPFLKPVGRGPQFAPYGFCEPEAAGTWSQERGGMLRLRGQPVGPSENVEIRVDAHPFIDPAANVTSQRLLLTINDTWIGPEVRLKEDGVAVYSVPGPLWNRTVGTRIGGAVGCIFPDAIRHTSDRLLGEDMRMLGIRFRGIHFQAVPAVHSQPALVLDSPGHEAKLDFKPGGNSLMYVGEGWSPPEIWGTWSDLPASELRFHSGVVDGTHNVEISLDIHSVMDTDSAIKGQRVRVLLGNLPLKSGESMIKTDREHVVDDAGRLVLTVPSTIWNWTVANDAEAVLRLEFPDAISPAELDPTGKKMDRRQLAVEVEGITFRDVKPLALTSR